MYSAISWKFFLFVLQYHVCIIYSYCSTMFVLLFLYHVCIIIFVPCLYYYLFTVNKYNSKDICLDDSYNEYENPYSAFCGSVTFSVIDDVPVCFRFYDSFSSISFSKLRYCSATVEINKKWVLVSFKWILFLHSYLRVKRAFVFFFFASVRPSSGSYSKKCPPIKPPSQFQIKVGVNYPNDIRRVRRGRMRVGFTTTHAISAFHH